MSRRPVCVSCGIRLKPNDLVIAGRCADCHERESKDKR